jgi:hypothetical protein
MKYLLTYQDTIATDLVNNHQYELAMQMSMGGEKDGDKQHMF